MKATRLICILALAMAVGACGDSSDGNGGDGGSGAVGGDGGSGGSGGATDQCTNDSDQDVYEDIGDGDAEAGQEEVSDVASACAQDECGNFFGLVIGDPSEENIQNLADCVVDCTGDFADLSDGCLDCYGGVVACGGAFCVGACAADTTSELCTNCLADNGCTGDFEDCSGLVSSNDP